MVCRTFFERCLTLGSVGQLLCSGAEQQISRIMEGWWGRTGVAHLGIFLPGLFTGHEAVRTEELVYQKLPCQAVQQDLFTSKVN